MKNLIISNFKENKKTTVILLISISVSFLLLFLSTFILSSIHKFMVSEVIKNSGSYHVKVKTNLSGFEDFSIIKKIEWQEDYVLITYNNMKEVYHLTDKVCEKAKCEDITYNTPYLSLYGISKDGNLLKTFKKLIIITLLVITISAFFIIYNVYSIFLNQKYRQIGILKSIGITSKQLRLMLFLEGIIIGILSIVISFILSILIMFILTKVLNNLLNGLISFSINTKFLIYSSVFIILLVILISLIPVLKVKKLELINLLNQGYKRKDLKKEYNVIYLIAKTNYKRSKKHYRPVIISLFICIILYLTFNIYLTYGLEIINKYITYPKYDVEITIKNKNEEGSKLLNDFAHKYASNYKIYTYCNLEINMDKNNYLKDGNDKLNLYLVKGNNYFINKSRTILNKNNKIFKEEKIYFKNKINLNVNGKNISLKESFNTPYGFETLLTKDNLVAFYKNINEVCTPNATLFMESNKNIDSKLDELLEKGFDLYYVNVKKGKTMINNVILGIKIILYGVLILTIIVGLSSVVSASYLSMEYRKKEFGILKCLGLTKIQFKNIIILESLFITFKAFLIAMPFTFLINAFTNNVINEIIDIKLITFYKPFLLCLLVSVIMLRMVMELSYKKVEKASALELLNKENV